MINWHHNCFLCKIWLHGNLKTNQFEYLGKFCGTFPSPQTFFSNGSLKTYNILKPSTKPHVPDTYQSLFGTLKLPFRPKPWNCYSVPYARHAARTFVKYHREVLDLACLLGRWRPIGGNHYRELLAVIIRHGYGALMWGPDHVGKRCRIDHSLSGIEIASLNNASF